MGSGFRPAACGSCGSCPFPRPARGWRVGREQMACPAWDLHVGWAWPSGSVAPPPPTHPWETETHKEGRQRPHDVPEPSGAIGTLWSPDIGLLWGSTE